MARGVLGNDPFKRGAAVRPAEAEPSAEPEAAAAPAEQKPASKKKQKAAKATPPAKKKASAASAKKKKKAPSQPPEQRAAKEQAPVEVPAEPERTDFTQLAGAEPEAVEQPPAPHIEPAPEPAAPAQPRRAPELPREQAAASPASLRDRAVGALVVGRDLLATASESGALSRVFETATGLLRAVQTGLGTGGGAHLDEYGRDADLAHELRGFGDFFYDRYWRVTVEGAHNVPSGPCVLVANHSGAMPLDGLVLKSALSRERGDLAEARWLVEDQVFHAPFVGVLLNRLGAVRACPENALRLLSEGRPVIVFPEGVQGISKPFRERYRLMRFGRGGFVKIALRARTPIVPVAIVGAEESMPLMARLPGKFLGVPYLPLTSPVPLPARWTVRFGEPLDVQDDPPEAADDLVRVHQLTDRTREGVQGMLDALVRARRSVFA